MARCVAVVPAVARVALVTPLRTQTALPWGETVTHDAAAPASVDSAAVCGARALSRCTSAALGLHGTQVSGLWPSRDLVRLVLAGALIPRRKLLSGDGRTVLVGRLAPSRHRTRAHARALVKAMVDGFREWRAETVAAQSVHVVKRNCVGAAQSQRTGRVKGAV